ncbi:class I SAM-dependent methyltransferase [Acidipila sp. EB88]|uniref:class I SAM-dependent methyltransferase n=1 Tax=Acidipila sp. EB88 TaxID=2305226 RepID=UPI000F601FBF|nr:class I SAM-dependent methyltransferase [Acidipila sp. EB88]RRA50229.1 class I SAM-dependent methyltransferase [Acidipila sp. EB88]
MLRSLFSRRDDGKGKSPTLLSGPRIPRHSSAWAALRKHLASEPNLRVLDIGPTSPANVNYLTQAGHGVWMADLATEALKGPWETPPTEPGGESTFDTAGFFQQNMDFGGREFDVVLLWTALDYIPEGLVQPLIAELRKAVRPGGRLLAIFHTKLVGPNTEFYRYHLTDSDSVEMQETQKFPVRRVYTNRNIEKLFADFNNTRFFLAKDNLYEVLITR